MLVTIRHAEPKAFELFLSRALKPGAVHAANGELVMLGLLEAMIDRLADALESAGNEVDGLSHEIFRHSAPHSGRATRNLRALIERIGRKGDLLTLARESLVSITRLTTYHAALDAETRKPSKEVKARIKVIQRDVLSLSDHATFLSAKINFMLDATLGLINLEQTEIIKIFSVAAVILLPPTLVASVYGMNFEHMPGVAVAIRLSLGAWVDGGVGHRALSVLQEARLAVGQAPAGQQAAQRVQAAGRGAEPGSRTEAVRCHRLPAAGGTDALAGKGLVVTDPLG